MFGSPWRILSSQFHSFSLALAAAAGSHLQPAGSLLQEVGFDYQLLGFPLPKEKKEE